MPKINSKDYEIEDSKSQPKREKMKANKKIKKMKKTEKF